MREANDGNHLHPPSIIMEPDEEVTWEEAWDAHIQPDLCLPTGLVNNKPIDWKALVS